MKNILHRSELYQLAWREFSNSAVLAGAIFTLTIALLGALYFFDLDAVYFAPAAITALAAAVWAADAGTCDAPGRRLATLLMLPARPVKVWLAKVLFVLIILFIYISFLLLADALFAWYVGRVSITTGRGELLQTFLVMYLFAFCVASAVLAAAAIFAHGFAALVTGALVIAGLVFTSLQVAEYLKYMGYKAGSGFVLSAAAGVSIFFLILSTILFCCIRGYGRPRWKRLTGMLAMLLILSGGIVAGTDHYIYYQGIVTPGNPNAVLHEVSVSPDGKTASLELIHKDGPNYAGRFVWLIDIETARITPLPEYSLWVYDNSWKISGQIQLAHENVFNRDDNNGEVVVVNTTNGKIIERRELLREDILPEPRWAIVRSTTIPEITSKSLTVGVTVAVRDTSIKKEFTSYRIYTGSHYSAAPLPQPGEFLSSDTERNAVYYNLNTNEERILKKGGVSRIRLSKDGARAIIQQDHEANIIDIKSGSTIGPPLPVLPDGADANAARKKSYLFHNYTWLKGDINGRFVMKSTFRQAEISILDIVNGTETLLDTRSHEGVALRGDSELVIIRKNNSVELTD
ncbi:MAG: hypothetical protein ACKVS6_01840, partial [Planctomycetota bacterium]